MVNGFKTSDTNPLVQMEVLNDILPPPKKKERKYWRERNIELVEISIMSVNKYICFYILLVSYYRDSCEGCDFNDKANQIGK